MCFVEGCKNADVAQFVWPWGESGLTCAQHQIILSQRSKQLKRDVVITPLQPAAPSPMTRDERIQARARIMTLEEENDELRKRGQDLYRQNEDLKTQVRHALNNASSIDKELASVVEERDSLRQLLGEAQRAAAKENDELQQLRALLPS